MELVLKEWLGASAAWAATAAAWEAAGERHPAALSEIRSRWASAGGTWAAAASSWSPGASSTWAPGDASWRRTSVSWAQAARLWAFAGSSWAGSAHWFAEYDHQSWFWANTAREWGDEAMSWARKPRDWDSSTLWWADVAGMHSLAGEESAKLAALSCVTAAPGPGQFQAPMDSSPLSDGVFASSSALPLPMLSDSGEQGKATESEESTEMEEEAEKAVATADGAARDKGKEMAGVTAAGSRARAPVPARKEETPALPDLNDMQAFPEIPAPVPGRSRPPKPGRQSRHSST